VLLDIFTEDKKWFDWSSNALAEAANRGFLAINPVIYSEVSVGFERVEDLDSLLALEYFTRAEIPYSAAFLAGKCFLKYRRSGGVKTSPLPDFFIGAHAAVEHRPLLTRDSKRYRSYFPKLELICP